MFRSPLRARASMHPQFTRRHRLAAALGVALVGAVLFPVGSTDAATTSTCEVRPEIYGVTINQGLPYTELTQGKDVLVRLFLQKPKCADRIDVQLTGAALTATGAGQPAEVTSTVPALQDGDTAYPVVAPHGTFPVDHPGDPVLVMPGSAVTNLDGSAFTLSISATLEYRWRASSSDPWTAGTTAPTDRLVSGALMTAAVVKATKPLRVLVVPMGDLSAGVSGQFPAAATQAVENGMQTLNRLLPVAAGVGDLLGVTGGIRYRIAPGMIDLGPAGLNVMPVDADGVRRYCGSAGSFDGIAKRLAAFLVAWNTANPAFAADRAVGAIWEGVSKGSPCAEGVASVSTREAWVRAIPDRPATATTAGVPSKTGALLGMELQHTFGGVHPGAPNDKGTYHSTNSEADGGTQRAYHLTGASYLAADQSVMLYRSTGWDNTNTLLEQPDWERAQCVLTPPLPGQENPCPSGGLVGAPVAARGPSIVVAGVTDGTETGTDAHSYASEDVQRTPPVEASEYSIVQLAESGQEVQVDLFEVGAEDSDHSHDQSESVHSHLHEFDIAVALHAQSHRFQLRKGTTVLYERVSGDLPEFVGSAPAGPAGSLVRVTETQGDDVRPTLSRDGRLLAWESPAGVSLRLRGGGPTSEPIARAEQPALNDDGTLLAYVVDGNIWVADVAVDGGGRPVASGHRRVYDRLAQPLLDPAASAPSFSSGAEVAMAVNGDLWALDTDFQPSLGNPLICELGAQVSAPCRPLTTTSARESHPSWGSDGTIAYERDGALWTLDAASPATTQVARVADAGDPAMAAGVVAFTRGDSILAVSANRFDVVVTLADGGARSASLAGDGRTLAFDLPVGEQRDVHLLPLTAEGDSFVVRHPRPAELRADVWAVVGEAADPVVVALPPSSVQGDLATFTVTYDASALPPGSTRRVQVSDGWSTAQEEQSSTGGAAKPPVAAVYSPAVDTELLQFDSIAMAGSARDAVGTELQGPNLRWLHQAPGDAAPREVGTGSRVEGPDVTTTGHLDPPIGGWKAGLHTVTLRATDGAGATSETSVTFEILEDADRDGRPKGIDVGCPGSPGGDDDPYDAFGDDDRDGILNSDDPSPCTPDVDVTTDFDPDSLYVPSSGSMVTVYLSGSSELADVDPSSVAVAQLGYHDLETPLSAAAWSYDRKTGTATAKFDRQVLTAAMHERELVGGWVPVVLTGHSPSFSFRGVDPAAPVAFPAS